VSPSVGAANPTEHGSVNGTAQVLSARNSELLPPGVGATSATLDTSLSGAVPNFPDPAAQREQVFREFAMQYIQKPAPGAPHRGGSMENQQHRQTYGYYFGNNVAFWIYRERKECGPIRDSALYGDCVRSFKAQYPLHYAGQTKGTGDLKYWSSGRSSLSATHQ
jgi:hypothetical protein